jgi:hypothetical protein
MSGLDGRAPSGCRLRAGNGMTEIRRMRACGGYSAGRSRHFGELFGNEDVTGVSIDHLS